MKAQIKLDVLIIGDISAPTTPSALSEVCSFSRCRLLFRHRHIEPLKKMFPAILAKIVDLVVELHELVRRDEVYHPASLALCLFHDSLQRKLRPQQGFFII